MSLPGRLLLAVLFAPAFGQAADMRMCVDAYPHPPYLTPSGGGSVGRLVRNAARASGNKLSLYAAPLARCRAEIERGLAHAYPLTPYAPAVQPYVRYPMRGAQPDAARATVHARVVLFRPVGGSAQWDGRRITGVERKVLPLFETTCYLGVTKVFYARNGAAVERMWNAIGRLNQAAKAQEE